MTAPYTAIDFPAWLTKLGRRERSLAQRLLAGERTRDAARHFKVSPARVSQLRRALESSWLAFHHEPCS